MRVHLFTIMFMLLTERTLGLAVRTHEVATLVSAQNRSIYQALTPTIPWFEFDLSLLEPLSGTEINLSPAQMIAALIG